MVTPQEITTLMFAAGRLLRERAMADGSSISYLHVATLQYVAEKKQPLMREVAQYLRIAPPSATSLVNTLVEQGEIRRVADGGDRRVVRLGITAQGRKTLAGGTRRKHHLLQKVVQDLGERERVQLKNILEKIIRIAGEQ